jgi:uncharacterized repeat protein (TIGR03803 family)
VLYSFGGANNGDNGDGSDPNGGLIFDSKGAIYGTTYAGGKQGCNTTDTAGCGTVFKLIPPTNKGGAWTESQIYAFKGGSDGGLPAAGLIFDGDAFLYGTTVGTVFRIAPPEGGSSPWKQSILYTFTNVAFGPMGALIFDKAGNLYDTTYSGQTYSGTVFRLKRPSRKDGEWTFNLLYGFGGDPDGGQPAAGLVFHRSGHLYGTTFRGGTGNGSDCSHGCGTVFEVEP